MDQELNNILNNIPKFSNITEKKEKTIEINNHWYDNNWYSGIENESKFKVNFNREEVTSDAELNKSILRNSAKYLPNLHFINIKNPRLFKVV